LKKNETNIIIIIIKGLLWGTFFLTILDSSASHVSLNLWPIHSVVLMPNAPPPSSAFLVDRNLNADEDPRDLPKDVEFHGSFSQVILLHKITPKANRIRGAQ
jgi:hypothetical protein